MIFLKKISSLALHIILIYYYVSTQRFSYTQTVSDIVSIPACSDFAHSEHYDENETFSLTIPANRTYMSVYDPNNKIPLEFTLDANKTLKCAEKNSEIRKIPWDLETALPNLTPKNYSNVFSNTSDAHQHSYFTLSGHFYDHTSRYFYKPDGDYCVASYDNSSITLKVCTVNDDCSVSATSNTWCLPKCCAVGEVFLFWAQRCSTGGRALWNPPIYEGATSPDNKLDISSNNLIFRMSQMHKNCRNKVFTKTSMRPMFHWMSSIYSEHPKNSNHTQEKDNIKIIAPTGGNNGIVSPIYFNNKSGHWEILPNAEDFCIDGQFVRKGKSIIYTGKEDEFVILYCEKEANKESHSLTNSWIYFAVSIVASFFLFAIIAVYSALWEKHNLHGMTILSYSVVTFGSYIFLGVAHAESLFGFGNAVGVTTRGPWCYGNAVLAHYFFLSSYLWLTVMNFDLWWTFSNLRATRRDSKEWKKCGWYSLIAWILPFFLVTIFIIIDIEYSDPELSVPVPGYARSSCFILGKFRGEYLYTPMAIILGINIILIGLTMKIFITAGKASKSLAGGNSNAKRYSAKLFAKLFIVMGGVSVVDFITWYYNNKGHKHWGIAALEGISYLAPIALFILFCLNSRIVNQLRDKYPAFTDELEPVLKCFKKRDKNNSTSTTSNEQSSTRTNATKCASLERGSEMISLKDTSI